MKILLACDRSGGHIFPALAIAKNIKEKSVVITEDSGGRRAIAHQDEIYFFAASESLRGYLAKEGFPVYGKIFSSRNLPIELAFRAIEAVYLLLKLRPQKLIGFGGRDSFFLILLGTFAFLDTAIYEPNITFGKANKVLAFFVRKIFCGFQETVAGKKVKAVGIPLRKNIKVIPKAEALKVLGFGSQPVIFCFGGSQGSHFLNTVFMKLVESLKGDCQVIHLTGKREYFQITQFYNKIERKSFVRDFYYAMEVLYSASDVVVCRAGALSLGELIYYALPAILIPHPAAGGHQKENAFYLAKKGAARVLLQEDFSFEVFRGIAEKLLYDKEQRESLRQNLRKIKLGVDFEEFSSSIYF